MFITFGGLVESRDNIKASLVERDFMPPRWLTWLADLLSPPVRYSKDEREILGLLSGLNPNDPDPGTRQTVRNLRAVYTRVSMVKVARGLPYAVRIDDYDPAVRRTYVEPDFNLIARPPWDRE